MDLEEYNNDEASFKLWLNFFCSECEKRHAADDDSLPLIPPFTRFTDNETEGECLSWCLQLLTMRKCPNVLACHLARSVYLSMAALDQSPFYKQSSNEGLTEIDSHRYMRATYQKLCSICDEWREYLPPIHIHKSLPLISSHAIKNTRRKMEDRHVIISDVNALLGFQDAVNESFYGVFDGHAGPDAAIYASTHLHCNITRDENHNTDVQRALFNAHNLTDQHFLAKSKREALKSGTTCVSMLIRGDQIHVSWLGDSQAILVRDGQAVILTSSHKPERLDEKQRIEELGGCVVWYGTWRVNGNIAVSRAIGDRGHKPYISSDPDTLSLTMDGTEEYIVLACDGAWDTLAKEEIPKIVYDHLKYNDGDLTTAARSIVVAARDNGSADNITVVVVFFKTSLTVPAGCTSKNDEVMVKEERRDSEQHDDYSPTDCTSQKSSRDGHDNDAAVNSSDNHTFSWALHSCFNKNYKNVGNLLQSSIGSFDHPVSSDSNNNAVGVDSDSFNSSRSFNKDINVDNARSEVQTSNEYDSGSRSKDVNENVGKLNVGHGGRHAIIRMGADSQRSFYYGNSQYMPSFYKKSSLAQRRRLTIDFDCVVPTTTVNCKANRLGLSKSANPFVGNKKANGHFGLDMVADPGPTIWSFLAAPRHSVDNYKLNLSLGKLHGRNLGSTSKSPRFNSAPVNKMLSTPSQLASVNFGSDKTAVHLIVNDQFKPGTKLRMKSRSSWSPACGPLFCIDGSNHR